jgi:two-component system, chemotaxis family, protein-glutamate methylesterase/glutaminase
MSVQPPSRAIGVCASAGGPAALEQLLGALPADYAPPLLVVQHIADGFADGLARLLDSQIALPVALASDGAPLAPGVWLAPDDAHLTVTRARRIALDRETVVGRHRPSCDMLLDSLATVFRERAVGVVLTGMGRDGAHGAAALKAAGGLLLAQDEHTAPLYGMPGAAVAAGARALPPDQIAALLRGLDRAVSR